MVYGITKISTMDNTTNELSKYDFILLLDKSGSMGTKDMPGAKSRWEAAKEATLAVARKCVEFDSDGITVIVFNDNFKEYKNVTGGEDTVERIFRENEPSLGTDTAKVLNHVFNDYFKTKAKPIIVICVTDGAPSDPAAVATAIINASNRMEKDEEIGVQFIQIGNDAGATTFLKSLDDDLVSKGAKFDIVDTKTTEEMGDMLITDVLLAALND